MRRRLDPPPRRLLPTFALALAALASGCGSREPAVPLPTRSAEGLGEAHVEALGRILWLEDRRQYDRLFEELADSGPVELRRRAVVAAGRTGDSRARSLLVGVLERERDAAVRAEAAFALGELGDTSAVVVDALMGAIPSGWIPVRDAETAVAAEIVAALGKLGTDRARRELVDALRKVHPATGARTAGVAGPALLALWRFPDAPGAALAIERYLGSVDPELRWRAAYALSRGGEPGALPRLLPHAADRDPRVRKQVVRALQADRADSARVRDSALIVLRGALDDPHPHVRINALRSLATYGAGAPVAAVGARVRDPDHNVGMAAIGALGSLGALPATDSLLANAVDDPSLPLPLRGAALEQLGRVDSRGATSRLPAWLAGGFQERYFAARALATLDADRAGALLARLMEDDDLRVAVAAIVAAGALVTDTTDAPLLRPALLAAAASDHPRTRGAALRALAGLAGPAEAPVLVDAFHRAARATRAAPVDPAERQAAIAALGALAAAAGRGAEVRSRVLSGHSAEPPTADPWVLRAAAEELDEPWGPPPPAVASTRPDFYEDVARRFILGPLTGEPRPRARIMTAAGSIVVELLSEEAPLTVENFVRLAGSGYYDEGVWHRVVPDFVLQDGAPAGEPSGGPGWAIRDEINRVRYGRGVVGMALSGPDTGGSQWFITHSPQPHLDGGYTVFGRVVEGMEAADAVLQGDPIRTVRVVR